MPLAPEDPVLARRALALALADFLDASAVRDAVALWNTEFAGRGTLFAGLTRYCRQIADAFGLAGREAELHLRIFRALQVDPARLPRDPLAGTEPEPTRAPAPPAAGGAAVVEAFFAAVEAGLVHDPAANGLRLALLRHARRLPPPLAAPLVAWWSGAASRLGGDWPAGGAGTRLVNLVYVALAECLGPTRADQVFTEAVLRLERADDAALRGIRAWL